MALAKALNDLPEQQPLLVRLLVSANQHDDRIPVVTCVHGTKSTTFTWVHYPHSSVTSMGNNNCVTKNAMPAVSPKRQENVAEASKVRLEQGT